MFSPIYSKWFTGIYCCPILKGALCLMRYIGMMRSTCETVELS